MTSDQYTTAHTLKSELSDIEMKRYVLRAEIEKSERIGTPYEKMRVVDMRKWLSELERLEKELTDRFDKL